MSPEPTDPKGQEPDPKEPHEPKGQEPKAEPKTFDEDYVKQLRKEAAEWRTKAQEATTKVQEFEDADKTEKQKAEERATTAEGRAGAAELKLLRFEVAAAKDIPLKHAHRLQGSTKEELEADAEELAKELGGAGTRPDYGSGARGTTTPTSGPAEMDRRIRQAAGRQ